jgi:hypothetical protein
VLRQAATVARRDLRTEAATLEASVTVPPLVMAGLLLSALGLEVPTRQLAVAAPGLVWLIVLLVTVPLTRALVAAERDDDSWDLLVSLVSPTALFIGKVASLCLQLTLVWAFGALLSVPLLETSWSPFALLAAVVAMPGIAANATVYGLLVGGERRPALMTTLALTAGLPALVAGTQVAAGDGIGAWFVLLGVYDVVACVTAWAVFPTLLEA